MNALLVLSSGIILAIAGCQAYSPPAPAIAAACEPGQRGCMEAYPPYERVIQPAACIGR